MNFFHTVWHIKRTDGFFGCYAGAGPRMFGTLFSEIASGIVTSKYMGDEAIMIKLTVDEWVVFF